MYIVKIKNTIYLTTVRHIKKTTGNNNREQLIYFYL